jgi:hypothetical protein
MTAGLLREAVIGEARARNDNNKYLAILPAEGQFG